MITSRLLDQGENNMWDGIEQCHCSGDALARSWRDAFDTAFPWFVVQLAPCSGDNDGLIAGSFVREAYVLLLAALAWARGRSVSSAPSIDPLSTRFERRTEPMQFGDFYFYLDLSLSLSLQRAHRNRWRLIK